MGGAIHPSIAISKPEVFVGERYGDITLVGDKDFIDPKNRQNKVKVFDNDIYSPRVPKPDYKVKNIPNEYKEMMAKTNYDPIQLLNYPKDVIGEGLDSKIYRDSYMANKAGVDNIANVPSDKYSEYLKEDIFNKSEYRDYAKKMHNMLEMEKRLLMGETSVGGAIYKPYTPENILKKMNKTELKGGERSYSSSPDYVYAAEELKNIKAIKNKKDLLQKVDIEKLNQIRDKNSKLADKIADALEEQGIYFYQGKEKIADYLNTGNTEGLTAKSIALLDAYKKELDSDPRLYFEAKMRRMVGLDEFKKAVIPDDLDDETRAILKNRGVETIEYKAGDNADRMAKLNALDDLKFKKTQAINEELATKQDLLARHLELTGDEKLAFNEWQNAMQKKALGYYNPETDSINLNKLSMDTLNHEIGHKILAKVENKEELLSEIKRSYGEDNLIATYGKLYNTNDLDLLAEEKLADGFTDYYNGIKNGKDIRILGQELRIPPKVLAIYDRIVEAIKGLIGKQDQIKQFYSQMETGKFRENNGLANISEQTAYKIHDTPNGKYVEIEGDPLEGVPYKDIPRKVKQVIAERFQGNSYQIGDTDNYAGVTARSKRELAYKQQQMNGSDYVKKATMSHNLDELIESMSSVRTVPNLKKDSKPNVAGYIYGDVDVKIGDQIFTARVNIEQNVNGQKIIYDISNIKRGGGESAAKLNSLPRSSNTNSIPQNSNDVNTADPENRYLLNSNPETNTPLKKQGIVKNLKIEDGEINNFIKDQVKKQNNQNKVPLKEKLADNVANLKHYLIDDAVAYERYTKDKALKKELREGIDRVRSSEAIASQFIRDTGLSKALGKMSKEEQNEFSQYLIAKRHLEVADRDIATGRDLNIDKAIVDKFGEKYKVAEEVYRNHNKAMLEHMAEHGLISSDLKDKLIAENPNYAPLQRIMDETENFSGNSKQLGNLSNQSVVKGLKGSERVVDNPLEATLNNTFRMINEVERNKVARSLAENVFGGDNVEVTRDMPNWVKQPNMERDSYSPRSETVNKIAEDSKGRYVENTEYKNVFENGQELKERAKNLQTFLNDNFRNKTYQDENNQDIEITKKGINKAISLDGRIKDGDIRGANQNAHVELDNIIKTSRKATEEEINRLVANKTVNTKAGRDFEYNYVRFKDNGNEYEGLLNVANYKGGNGDIFYGIKPIKKSPVDGPEGIRPEALENNLPDRKGIVKGLRLGETEKLAYLDNGRKVEIEVPKLVAKEMKNLNGVLPDGLDKVIGVLAMPAKTLRAGATGLNPIFVASNLVRDQIQSAVSGGNGRHACLRSMCRSA